MAQLTKTKVIRISETQHKTRILGFNAKGEKRILSVLKPLLEISKNKKAKN